MKKSVATEKAYSQAVMHKVGQSQDRAGSGRSGSRIPTATTTTAPSVSAGDGPRSKYFAENPPARLPRDVRVEIDAIAIVG